MSLKATNPWFDFEPSSARYWMVPWVAGAAAAELVRSLFNLLRAKAPDPSTDAGKTLISDVLGCVSALLQCASGADGVLHTSATLHCSSVESLDPAYRRRVS